MGRKVTTGVQPQGFGDLNIANNTIKTVDLNQNLILDPNGTGVIQAESGITLTTGNALLQAGNVVLNAQGDVQFFDSDSSNYVAFQAPATVAANVTWTLPAADATVANYALRSNGSGTLTWGPAGPDITNETSSASTHYLLVTPNSTGVLTGVNVSTTKISYQPSTGRLSLGGGTASTSTTTGTFVVTGGAGISGALFVGGNIDSGGDITADGDITAFSTSDARLKTNIKPIANALDKVARLRGVTYDWSAEYLDTKFGRTKDIMSRTDCGLLAHELEEVLPEAVAEKANGYKGVRYEKTVSLLVEAIKELKQEVETLKMKG